MANFKILNTPLRFVLFFVLIFSANLTFAEESGGFVGLEIGAGEANLKSTMISFQDTTSLESINLISGLQTPYYGLIAGYKQFFNRYVGLRYYANINVFHFTLVPKNCKATTCNVFAFSGTITMINYGANIDFMANVLASENADLGGFVGVGLGGDSWMGKGIEHQLELYKITYPNGMQDLRLKNKTSFNVWINVGLRTNFAKYHGIELVARAPLLEAKLLNDNFVVFALIDTKKAKATIKGIYSISVRYAFSF